MRDILTKLIVFFVTIFLCVNTVIPPFQTRCVPLADGETVNVMSFNVYIAGAGDDSPVNRTKRVTAVIESRSPDSLGLQEANLAWIERITETLPQYAYVGVGRDDGDKAGEFSPVLYLKSKFRVVDSGTFWFSETPEKPSRGWDAMCRRICTWAVLENLETGFRYAHFNAHLDNAGSISRRHSAEILTEHISSLGYDVPVVLTGDFNCNEGSEPYKTILNGGMADTKFTADKTMSTGTWHNFGLNNVEKKKPIDFIFTSADKSEVLEYEVVTDKVDGKYPSDHFPVAAEIELSENESPITTRVMSFNVLCYGINENFFTKRIELVTQTITDAAPDVFGLQEAHYAWVAPLQKIFKGSYAYVGVGRDDGKTGGEFSPIFYRVDKYKLIDSGTFWLSETPETPSMGWDAACKRVCSFAVLEEKDSGKRFAYLNTHLDHVGDEARIKGVALIIEKAKSFGLPFFITGDFNIHPLTQLYRNITGSGIADSKVAVGAENCATFNDLDPTVFDNLSSEHNRIDYVFFDSQNVSAANYHVMAQLIDGRFASDHFAIYADLYFKN